MIEFIYLVSYIMEYIKQNFIYDAELVKLVDTFKRGAVYYKIWYTIF